MDGRVLKWKHEFNKAGINFRSLNTGYHLKVGPINFYPTKQSWYNEQTGKKGYWSGIEDVIELVKNQHVTQETVFNDIASNMVPNFDLKKFQEENWVLYKAIIESMNTWANQKT